MTKSKTRKRKMKIPYTFDAANPTLKDVIVMMDAAGLDMRVWIDAKGPFVEAEASEAMTKSKPKVICDHATKTCHPGLPCPHAKPHKRLADTCSVGYCPAGIVKCVTCHTAVKRKVKP